MAPDDGVNDAAYRVHVCFGPNCTPRGSRDTFAALLAAVQREGLAGRVEVMATSCRNRCEYGPSVNVYPGPVFYNEVTETAAEEIVAEHLRDGQPVKRLHFSSVLSRRSALPKHHRGNAGSRDRRRP